MKQTIFGKCNFQLNNVVLLWMLFMKKTGLFVDSWALKTFPFLPKLAAAASHMNIPLVLVWFCASLLRVWPQMSRALRCSEMMAQSGWIASAWKYEACWLSYKADTCIASRRSSLVAWRSCEAWVIAAMEKKRSLVTRHQQAHRFGRMFSFLFCFSLINVQLFFYFFSKKKQNSLCCHKISSEDDHVLFPKSRRWKICLGFI